MDGDARRIRKRVRALIQQMGGKEGARRIAAESELYALGPTAMATLIRELERIVRNRQLLPWFLLGYLVLTPLATYLMFTLLFPGSTGWVGGCIGGLTPSLYRVPQLLREGRTNAAKVLANLQDARAVGPLAIALFEASREVRPAVRIALLRLLPRIVTTDSPTLSPTGRSALRRIMFGEDVDLTVAVLGAIERVGDASAVEPVQRIADGLPGRGAQVREAAARCLPSLLARVEAERHGATLLRPSEAAESQLLRRAGTVETAAEQLLRPSG